MTFVEYPKPNSKLGKETGKRRGGRPSRREAELLTEAIIDAAEQEFLEQGFGGANIETIAAKAGTAKQTIYSKFNSKENLFIAVSSRILAASLPERPEHQGSVHEQLRAVSKEMLAAILNPKLIRMHSIITAEAARFPELARLTDEDETFPGRILMRTIIADAARRGEIRCDNPQRAMEMLQTMVVSAPLRWEALSLRQFDQAAQAQWADYAVDLFLHGCLP